MAAFARFRLEREFGRSSYPERRSAQDNTSPSLLSSTPTRSAETLDASSSVAASSSSESTAASDAVKALAGVVAVLVVAIIVALAWKYRRWWQSRKTPASSLVKSPGSEKKVLWPKSSLRQKLELDASRAPKSNAVVLPPVPPTPDVDAGWMPRVTPWRPPSMPRPKTLFLPSILAEAGRLTPPPTYYVANGGVPSPSSSMVKTPIPSPLSLPAPPPPTARKLSEKPNIPAPLKLKVTPPTPSLVPEPAVESPSPQRIDSLKPFNAELYEKPSAPMAGSSIYTHSRSGSSGSISRHPYHSAHRQKKKKLPRLVTVILDFTPSLADELAIRAGDTVRLLAEYEDQWCLVQQVGKADSQKGAVPQFCVQDRPDMIPTPQSSSFFPLTHSRSRSSISSFTSIV